MGFHGYGHTSRIIGDYSISDCPEGPQTRRHSHDLTFHNHGHDCVHPNRTMVPRHRNNGPVDLSQYCTPTGRGTWSIGGQRAAPRVPKYSQIQSACIQNETKSQSDMALAFCPTPHVFQHPGDPADNTSPVGQACLYQSPPNVDIPKVTSDDDDAKNDRSNGGTERVELSRKAAASFDFVRAMAFPIPVLHVHSHISANAAKILDAGKASTSSPSTTTSQRANGGSSGIYGISATVDAAAHVDKRRPWISNSSSQSDSTAFSEVESTRTCDEESLSAPSSCCESNNEVNESGKCAH